MFGLPVSDDFAQTLRAQLALRGVGQPTGDGATVGGFADAIGKLGLDRDGKTSGRHTAILLGRRLWGPTFEPRHATVDGSACVALNALSGAEVATSEPAAEQACEDRSYEGVELGGIEPPSARW